MTTLEDPIRLALEKTIDQYIIEVKDTEELQSVILKFQGIEPNLETILSHIIGVLYGMTLSYYVSKRNRNMTDAERLDFLLLMKRRAWELREAMISTRIGK